jgi:hypothetical protein
VKAVFDAAIKVVIKPPQKQKEKKKKPRRGCLLLVLSFLTIKRLFYYPSIMQFLGIVSHCVWELSIAKVLYS